MDTWGAEQIADHITATVQKSGNNAPIYLRYYSLFKRENIDTHAASVDLPALI